PDPSATFASVYGADARRVEGSNATKDDLEFAQKLFDAAKVAIDAPMLQRLLYEKAVDYASRDAAGAPVALSALTALRTTYPGDSARWDDKAVVIQEKVYRAAPIADRPAAASALKTVLMVAADRQAAAGRFTEALALARRATEVSRTGGGEDATEVQDLVK